MDGRLGRVAAVAQVAVLLAGCGVMTTVRSNVSGSSCASITSGACSEQVEVVVGRHPGATNVDLVCSIPICDRRVGRGTAVVTLADGTKVNDTFAYAGNPVPVPAPVCAGMAQDVCAMVTTGIEDELRPSETVVRIEITCTVAPCTRASGEVGVKVTMADGSVRESGHGWEGAP